MLDWSKMPSDENQLWNDLAAADAAGDKELANIIAKRLNMVESANASNVKMEDEYNAAEKFLIGAGRGFYDLAQGAKQKALMIGEDLGLVDEGRAQEYTAEVTKQQQEFEEDFPGIGAESVGRFAGWAAPGLLTGGGGIGTAVGMGALEGAIMPTEEASYEEMAKNAAIGAGIGLAGKGIQQGLQSVRGKELIRSQVEKAEDLYNRYSPSSSMQDEFIQGIDDMGEAVGARWDALDDLVGARPVDDTPIYESILSEIDSLQRAGGDPTSMNKLIKLWDNMPRGKDGQVRWGDLKEFRSNFAGANAANFAKEGMSPAIVKRLYGDITEVMKRNLANDTEYRMFQEAVDATKQRKDLIKQSKAPPRVREGIPDEAWFENVLQSGKRDQTSAIMQLMTDDGAEGAKAFLMRGMTKDFLEGGGSNIPSTTRFKKILDSADSIFEPDEAAELRGFVEFLDAAKDEKSLQTLLSNIMTAGSLVGGAKAIPAKFMLPSLMRSKESKAILRKLSKTQPKTRLYRDLIGALTSSLTQGTAAGFANDPVMQVEIRNGRTQ